MKKVMTMNDRDLLISHIEWLRGDHDQCNPWLADTIEGLLKDRDGLVGAGNTLALRLKNVVGREMIVDNWYKASAKFPGLEVWEVLLQDQQPLLSDGYDVIEFIEPGVWRVRRSA